MQRPLAGEIYLLTFVYSTEDWQMTSATCLVKCLGFDEDNETTGFTTLEEFSPPDMIDLNWRMELGYTFGVYDENFPVRVVYSSHIQYIIYTRKEKSICSES